MESIRLNMVLLFCLAAMVMFQMQSSYAQKTHNLAWVIPTNANAYTTWAASQTFAVGDTLVFNFTTGAHTAAQVTKRAYDACTIANPIALWSTGPSSVVLNSSGPHYYLCTIPSHCNLGQKVTITVAAAATSPASAPSPAGATPPPAPTPTGTPTSPPSDETAPAPASSTTPSAAAPGESTTPSSPNSAAFVSAAALPLTILSIATALFY